jgi:subtilisin-like proprotein convertase family protein/subtilisin family serine protease
MTLLPKLKSWISRARSKWGRIPPPLVPAAITLAAAAMMGSAARGQDTVPYAFRLPWKMTVQAPTKPRVTQQSIKSSQSVWIQSVTVQGSPVEFGSRIVLQTGPGTPLDTLIQDRPLKLSRTVSPGLVILQAPDPWTAMEEADKLAVRPEVHACYPAIRRQAAQLGLYAHKPNDPYFKYQWNLENRDVNGAALGPDMNVRAAWPLSTGYGVTIAQADDGIEMAHLELHRSTLGAPHFNFHTGETNGEPMSTAMAHGTAVAGLIGAELNNDRGMSGLAPDASLASWVIFGSGDILPSDEALMDMFQYCSNVVSVQNHSWGPVGFSPSGPTLLEQTGMSNAFTFGRSGLGSVLVFAGGNSRDSDPNATGNPASRIVGVNANDNGYLTDPHIISVGAVRSNGRVTTYSCPGACLLAAAPSGDYDYDPQYPNIFATDRLGANGFNYATYTNDFADYAFDAHGFNGTSAAAPQVAAVAGLMLAANPALALRDVQQILLLSCRHFDFSDPDLSTNGAGLAVSHNDGFGVPDSGVAVSLARSWSNRPPVVQVSFTNETALPIPAAGIRVRVSGPDVPDSLTNILCQAGEGPHPDDGTPSLPLVDAGLAASGLDMDLTDRAAFIQRGGGVFFKDKIARAAAAGASFAIIYNNTDGDAILQMGDTEFTPIPAVFISQNSGSAVLDYLAQNPGAQAEVFLNSVVYEFAVTHTLQLEQITLTVKMDHPYRGDVRITVQSPQGTRSVMQKLNFDDQPAPTEWTYMSTHHFYESAAGTWKVQITDERADNVGSVHAVVLSLWGVPIADTDTDGLDDAWELAQFGNLNPGPRDDPNHNGYNNAREQVMGTEAARVSSSFPLDLMLWNDNMARISWPGDGYGAYSLLRGGNGASLDQVTNVHSAWPETLWFTHYTNIPVQLLRVRKP